VVFGAIVLTLAGAVFIALPLVAVLFVAAVAHRRSWGRGVLATAGLVATAVLVLAPFLTAARMPVERVVVVPPPKTTTTTTTPKPKPTKKPPTPQTKIVTVTDPDAVTGRSGIAAVLDVPSILAKRITDSLSSGELSTRKSIQRYELHLWRRYPVLGVGIGAADRHLAAQFSPRSLPSTYGVWWGVVAETGTLGLLAFVAVVAAFAWELVRTLRARPTSPWYPLLVGALVGVLAQLLSYGSFSERVDAHVWMLMGLGLLGAHAARRGEPV
jgi:O-antigen ligase